MAFHARPRALVRGLVSYGAQVIISLAKASSSTSVHIDFRLKYQNPFISHKTIKNL